MSECERPDGVETFEGYQLGKHMAKLTVADCDKTTILLRPRYALSNDRMRALMGGIDRWRKHTGAKIHVLMVPHDLDVFVVAGQGNDSRGDAANEGDSDVEGDQDRAEDSGDGGNTAPGVSD